MDYIRTFIGNLAILSTSFIIFSVVGAIFFWAGNRSARPSFVQSVLYLEQYRSSTTKMDLVHTILLIAGLGRVIGFASLTGLALILNGFLIENLGARTLTTDSVILLGVFHFFCAFIMGDLGEYLAHYLEHKIDILWRIHRVHHSAETLNPLSALRAHPLENMFVLAFVSGFSAIGLGLSLYITGSELGTVALGLIAAHSYVVGIKNLLNHCPRWISFGRLNYIFGAPVMHCIHHSAELRHRDKNMGNFLMIWDWMFGTIYVPSGPQTFRTGLNDEELGVRNPHLTAKKFYVDPIVEAYAAVVVCLERSIRRIRANLF